MGAKNSTKTQTFNQQVGASDDARVSANRISGSGNTATIAESGGFAITGTGNTLNLTDGGAVQAASDLLGRVVDSQSGITSAALSDLKEIALTKQTDGGNLTQKTILYLALGLGALWLLSRLFNR